LGIIASTYITTAAASISAPESTSYKHIPTWVDPHVRYHSRRGTDFTQSFNAIENSILCYPPIAATCNVSYYSQKIDHFSFLQSDVYQQKYLVYDKFYNPDAKTNPPTIFFYSGNEGPIELFAQNSGLLWDLAPSFSALLIFAEHRYYGKLKLLFIYLFISFECY
jgi:hypothetical protein